LPQAVLLDADTIARELKHPKGSNMVMLGAATPFLQLTSGEIAEAIAFIFKKKGEAVIEANIRAFNAGLDFSMKAFRR
jgi:indolepyruvate ferredoxin oxidoreductase beta subunit